MSKRDTICVVPYVALEIENDGYLTPCCDYPPTKSANFKDYDRWWSIDLNIVKTELHNNIKHKRCGVCWGKENLGPNSRRQMMNNAFPDVYNEILAATSPADIQLKNPKFIHINFGNTCNLKCIMCSPGFSSSLSTEYQLNKDKYNKLNINWDQDISSYKHKWYQSPEFLTFKDQLFTQDVEEVLLTGGEPMMIPESLELLESMKTPEKIQLNITTNGSYLNSRWIESFKKFKKVKISVSLEGIGEHNNYLRYGSDWNVIENNIRNLMLIDTVAVSVTTVIQHSSAYSFIDLLKFYINLQFKIIKLDNY